MKVFLKDPIWKHFYNEFYLPEFELESKILGDIDFQADFAENLKITFDFGIEEIKVRYSSFLHLNLTPSIEADSENQVIDNLVSLRRSSTDSNPDQSRKKDIEDNLQHELKELEGTSIENAFQDFSYWKPDVDLNVDDLISELNK